MKALARVVLVLALTVLAEVVSAARVVVDPRTGLALYGFDPVGYFTDGKPVMGRAELELPFAGATWRFHNEGNRDAFREDPEVYMPCYGGYDPVSLGRGVALPGHPDLWVMFKSQVYLFASQAARNAFLVDPPGVIVGAAAKWPDLQRSLLP
jgi:YHS domain-containing protein